MLGGRRAAAGRVRLKSASKETECKNNHVTGLPVIVCALWCLGCRMVPDGELDPEGFSGVG